MPLPVFVRATLGFATVKAFDFGAEATVEGRRDTVIGDRDRAHAAAPRFTLPARMTPEPAPRPPKAKSPLTVTGLAMVRTRPSLMSEVPAADPEIGGTDGAAGDRRPG
jgi:hypothetical protein